MNACVVTAGFNALRIFLAAAAVLVAAGPLWGDASYNNDRVDDAERHEAVIAFPETAFSSNRDLLGEVLRLKIGDNGGLCLDRDAWQSAPTGQSEESRLQEIKAAKKQLYPNLSDAFLSDMALRELNEEKGDMPPVARAFKKLPFRTEASGSSSRGKYYMFTAPGMDCRLDVDGDGTVKITVSETLDAFVPKSFSIVDDPMGEMSLFVFLGENGPYLNLEQKEMFSVMLVTDTEVSSRAAANFSVLADRDAAFLRGEVFPLLRHMGILSPPEYEGAVQ